MATRLRRNDSLAFGAMLGLVVIRSQQMLAELSQQFDVHAHQSKLKISSLLVSTYVFRDRAKV
jgi:transposase